MDAIAQWRIAMRLEKKLASMLRDRQYTPCLLEQTVTRLQEAYEAIIFQDYSFAQQNDVENRMWLKLHRIIEQYRQTLGQFQELHGKKRPVELRKLQDGFVGFIKQATRFYRSFIQRLISHFHLVELQWVVEKFHLTVSDPDTMVMCDAVTRREVIRSCHCSLVCLGDLSRYREIPRKPKNWGPAIGYYTLAKSLIPSSGSPHNQLAVIAMSDGSNLSATYHLYRALSVTQPFREAGDNLSLGFRKALKMYKAGTLGTNFIRKEENAVRELITLFVRLHAKCFTGKDFSDYETLESDMLTRLAQDLKDRNLSNGILNKMVLINIAAQDYAAKRASQHATSRSYSSFLRLNIATFTTLHQVFQPELERCAGERLANDVENVSTVGRRMLPSLRLYSTWLRVHYRTLVDQPAGTAISVLVQQSWQTYSNTLSLLASTFDLDTIPVLDYLLEEDNDTVGFLPFAPVNGKISANWKDEQHGESRHVHPNEEVLARIRLLLEDGKQLCDTEDVPITIINGTITCKEEGILTSTPSIGMNSGLTLASAFLNAKHLSARPVAESVLGQGGASIVDSMGGSETMNLAMNRMVDSLVGEKSEFEEEWGTGH